MSKKQRTQNRATAKKLKNSLPIKTICPECGESTTGHFVPPSFGEEGFFVCDKFYSDDGRRIT